MAETPLGPTLAAAQSAPVATPIPVVYAAKSSYRHAARAASASLRAQGIEVVEVELEPASVDPSSANADSLAKLTRLNPATVVVGGAPATDLVLHKLPRAKVVFFMVPNALDAPFLADDSLDRLRVAGVASDVAPGTQLRWIRALVPSQTRLAVLTSERTVRTGIALQEEGVRVGLMVEVIEADLDRFPAAIDALNARGVDGVLMIPDSRVYNAATVQRLLLWGARDRKGTWAFSENIVKAGAIGGIWVDSVSVGRQVADIVQRLLEGASPADIGLQYSSEIRKAFNGRTARLIGADVNDARLDSTTQRFGD